MTAYLLCWSFLIPEGGSKAPVLGNITSEHIPLLYVRHSTVAVRDISSECRITG